MIPLLNNPERGYNCPVGCVYIHASIGCPNNLCSNDARPLPSPLTGHCTACDRVIPSPACCHRGEILIAG
eukprot:COSAG02_NODE_121_length_35326_cov_25.450819_8_plen_70_part_00